MRALFEFLSGDRVGQQAVVTEPYVTFGRHPLCNVAFDAEDDVEVSGRHAAVFQEGGLFILHDLGSTNGTFVNGQRLHADHILATGDIIQFGTRGPKLGATIVRQDEVPYQPAAPSPTHYSAIPPRRTKEESSPIEEPPARDSGGTATRFRAVVMQQMSRIRRWLGALALLSVALVIVV
ncbi:MAG: FHA domain-containing protein [Gemmatimonadales bacterium]